MLLSAILSYLSYSLATAFTPGPNNILALYSVSQKGWRRGKSILCGIGFGFLSVMILCALFCYELVTYLPYVDEVLSSIDRLQNFRNDLAECRGTLRIGVGETLLYLSLIHI